MPPRWGPIPVGMLLNLGRSFGVDSREETLRFWNSDCWGRHEWPAWFSSFGEASDGWERERGTNSGSPVLPKLGNYWWSLSFKFHWPSYSLGVYLSSPLWGRRRASLCQVRSLAGSALLSSASSALFSSWPRSLCAHHAVLWRFDRRGSLTLSLSHLARIWVMTSFYQSTYESRTVTTRERYACVVLSSTIEYSQ